MVGLADGELVAFEFGELGGESEELLHSHGEIGAVEQPAAATLRDGLHLRKCEYQPVVPTTMRQPSARTARMFSTAASGVVKSTTASMPARLGAVSAEAC